MAVNEQFDDEELDDIDGGINEGNTNDGGEEESQPKKSLGERAQDIKDKYDQAKDLKKTYDRLKDAKKTVDTAKQAKQAADAAKAVKGAADAANVASTVGGGATATGGGAAIAGGTAATAGGTAAVAGGTAATAGGVAAAAVPIAIVLAILLVLALLVWIFTGIFMSGRNKINSMAGGSFFMVADYNNTEDQQIVESLQNKRDGNNPGHKLVIEGDGAGDIDWKWDDTTKKYTHQLDIRLLKTLAYLTDRHELVKIGMLRSNAPTLLRQKLPIKVKSSGDTEENSKSKFKETETFSAFYTGQGMAITAVDYSKNIKLPPKTPIEVDWQRTLVERAARPLWEELAFTSGYLDDKSLNYKKVAELEVGDPEMERIANQYLDATKTEEFDIFKEGFRKIDRIIQLLDRINLLDFGSSAGSLVGLTRGMDDRSVEYFNTAKGFFSELRDKTGQNPDASIGNAINAIRALGDNADLIAKGAAAVYKATQVANMVGWNERGLTILALNWNKAFEARNKIRQVTKELLEMPRVTAEAYAASRADVIGPPTALEFKKMKFTEDLVVKQIIAYSPEDDLDNGLMRIDVFPKGITAVGVGGVGIEGAEVKTEKDTEGNIVSAATIGDGVVDAMDAQFSYKPIDNGVFSKHGTNYIFIDVPDTALEWVGKFLKLTIGFGAAKALFEHWVGVCTYNPVYETCKPVTYKGFLHVAF